MQDLSPESINRRKHNFQQVRRQLPCTPESMRHNSEIIHRLLDSSPHLIKLILERSRNPLNLESVVLEGGLPNVTADVWVVQERLDACGSALYIISAFDIISSGKTTASEVFPIYDPSTLLTLDY